MGRRKREEGQAGRAGRGRGETASDGKPVWRVRRKPAAADGSGESSPASKPASSPFVAGIGDFGDGLADASQTEASAEGSFIPPGCDASDASNGQARCYGEALTRGFWCPPRLRHRNEGLIEAVNDWHFAMLNDVQRNEFYWESLASVVRGKRVVDIGAGSGLLSLMAARQGAASVVAIEASADMVELARLNAKRNGEDARVRVIHALSSSTSLREEERADVIVSETLGALMLGEGTLDYLSDARRRLAKPGATIIPSGGAQYAVLVASPCLSMISNVSPAHCHGFDLSAIGSLQDTGNLFFTKQWGFRLNSLPDLVEMSKRTCILEVDFGRTERCDIPLTKTFQLEALHDGVVHAVVASWEVWSGPAREHRIATHPEETKDQPWGFARDMQWGQGLQLVEDFDAASPSDRHAAPAPFNVKAGEKLLLTVRFSVPCRQTFQFTLRRAKAT